MVEKIVAHFLNPNRRADLIGKLSQLTMPYRIVIEYASLRDDLPFIDRNMAFYAVGIGNYCALLSEAVRRRNLEQTRNYRAFLEAHSTILAAYLAECEERNLLPLMPRFLEAARKSMISSKECKETILKAMGNTGMVQ